MKDLNPNGDGAKLALHKLAEQRPTDVLEYAALYISMELGVAPNQRGRKGPTVKGWPELTLGIEDIPDQ